MWAIPVQAPEILLALRVLRTMVFPVPATKNLLAVSKIPPRLNTVHPLLRMRLLLRLGANLPRHLGTEANRAAVLAILRALQAQAMGIVRLVLVQITKTRVLVTRVLQAVLQTPRRQNTVHPLLRISHLLRHLGTITLRHP